LKHCFAQAGLHPAIFVPASNSRCVRDPAWYRLTGTPVAKDGTMPFYRDVIREKGKLEIGLLSCGWCHTPVMPEGSLIKSGQGNFPCKRPRKKLPRGPVEHCGSVAALEDWFDTDRVYDDYAPTAFACMSSKIVRFLPPRKAWHFFMPSRNRPYPEGYEISRLGSPELV
jgi:hypothetical protein